MPKYGCFLIFLQIYLATVLVVFPGVAITLVVLGFNFFGDAVRDVFDPKLRGR